MLDLLNNPFSNIEPDRLQAIGQLSIAFNVLEEALCHGLAFLTNGDLQTTTCAVENASFTEKERAYRSLMKHFRSKHSKDEFALLELTELKLALGRARACNDFRNRLLHARKKITGTESFIVHEFEGEKVATYVSPRADLADKSGAVLKETPMDVQKEAHEAMDIAREIFVRSNRAAHFIWKFHAKPE